jgi:hypothetical protein
MATPQDIIKAMVASLHQRYLKPLGFRKSGTTWIRPIEWKHVINVQLSKWNSSEEAQFTVNLGISIEQLHAATESLPLTGALKEYDCDVRTRIGNLLLTKQDKWWTVKPDSDPEGLADDVFTNIAQHALPWFERLSNFETVGSEFLSQKNPFKAAVAYQLAGDADSAATAMTLAFNKASPLLLPKLRRIAIAQGIETKG